MKIIIEPFVILCTLFVLGLQVKSFISAVSCQSRSTYKQAILQISTILCILLYISYEFELAKLIYQNQAMEYTFGRSSGDYQVLHYLSENILRTISVLCINLITGTFKLLDNVYEYDSIHMRIAVGVYVVLRMIPISVIIKNLSESLSLSTVIMEIFLLSESILLFIIFFNLLRNIENTKKILNESYIAERFTIESHLDDNKNICVGFLFAFGIEIIFRIGFLILSTSEKSLGNLLLKDICNLLRVGYFMSIFNSIINLIFINHSEEKNSTSSINEKYKKHKTQKVRFFKFDLESTSEQSEEEVYLDSTDGRMAI